MILTWGAISLANARNLISEVFAFAVMLPRVKVITAVEKFLALGRGILVRRRMSTLKYLGVILLKVQVTRLPALLMEYHHQYQIF